MQHATVAKSSYTLLKYSTILNSISAERYKIQNNLLYVQAMNRAQTGTFLSGYTGLAKFLATSKLNSSKGIGDNPSSWEAVRLTGTHQNTSTPSSKQKLKMSEYAAFLKVTEEGPNPTERLAFKMKWTQLCLSKQFLSHSSRIPCH